MRSSRYLLHELSVGDNPISGRSSSKHSTLEVDRINRQYLEANNGSSPLAYLIPDNPLGNTLEKSQIIGTSSSRFSSDLSSAFFAAVTLEMALSSTLKASENSLIFPLGSLVVGSSRLASTILGHRGLDPLYGFFSPGPAV
ncbi:hypothetical protein Tco_0742395 [Tanacetum coccineum]